MYEFEEALDYEPELTDDNQSIKCRDETEKSKNEKNIALNDLRKSPTDDNTNCKNISPVGRRNKLVLNRDLIYFNQNGSTLNSIKNDNSKDTDHHNNDIVKPYNIRHNNKEKKNASKVPDSRPRNNFVIILNSQQPATPSSSQRIVIRNDSAEAVKCNSSQNQQDNNKNSSISCNNENNNSSLTSFLCKTDDNTYNTNTPDCLNSFNSTFRQIEVSSPSDHSEDECDPPNISSGKIQETPTQTPLKTSDRNLPKKLWQPEKVEKKYDRFVSSSRDKILQKLSDDYNLPTKELSQPKVEVLDEMEIHEEQIKWEEPSTSLKYFEVRKNPESKSFIIVSKTAAGPTISRNTADQQIQNKKNLQTSISQPVKTEPQQSRFPSDSEITFDSVSLMSDSEFQAIAELNDLLLSDLNDNSQCDKTVEIDKAVNSQSSTKYEVEQKQSNESECDVTQNENNSITLNSKSVLKLKRTKPINEAKSCSVSEESSKTTDSSGDDQIVKPKLAALLTSPLVSNIEIDSYPPPLKRIKFENCESNCIISPYFTKRPRKQKTKPYVSHSSQSATLQSPNSSCCSGMSTFTDSLENYSTSTALIKSQKLSSPVKITKIQETTHSESEESSVSLTCCPQYKVKNTSIDLSKQLVVRLEHISLPVSQTVKDFSSDSEIILTHKKSSKRTETNIDSVRRSPLKIQPKLPHILTIPSESVDKTKGFNLAHRHKSNNNSEFNEALSSPLDTNWHVTEAELDNSEPSKCFNNNSEIVQWPEKNLGSSENISELLPKGKKKHKKNKKRKKDKCNSGSKNTSTPKKRKKKKKLLVTGKLSCSSEINLPDQEMDGERDKLSIQSGNDVEQIQTDVSLTINKVIPQFPVIDEKPSEDHNDDKEEGEINSSTHKDSMSDISDVSLSLSVSSVQERQITTKIDNLGSNYTHSVQPSTNDLNSSGLRRQQHNQLDINEEVVNIPSENVETMRMEFVSNWLNRSKSPLLEDFEDVEANHPFHNSKVPNIFKELCLSNILNGCCYNSPRCNRNHDYSERLNNLSELSEKALMNAYNFSKTINNFYGKVYTYFSKAFANKGMKQNLIDMIHTIFEEKVHKINETEGLNQILLQLINTGMESLTEAIEYVVLTVGLKRHELLGASILEILYSQSNVLIHWPLIKKLALAGEKLPANVGTSFLTKLTQNSNDYQVLNDIYQCIVEYKFIDLSKIAPEVLEKFTCMSTSKSESFLSSENSIESNHDIHVQNKPEFELKKQVFTNQKGLFVIKVNNAPQTSIAPPTHLTKTASVVENINQEYYSCIQSDDNTSLQSSILRLNCRNDEDANSENLSFQTGSFETINMAANEQEFTDIHSNIRYIPRIAEQSKFVHCSDKFPQPISTTDSSYSFSQYDPLNSISEYKAYNCGTNSDTKTVARHLPEKFNGISKGSPRTPLEIPKFGVLHFHSKYKFSKSLHNLYLEKIESIDIDTDDVRELDECIRNGNAKRFLKLVEKYEGPLTVKNFIAMALADLNNLVQQKITTAYLDLVTEIETVDPDYYKNTNLRVILEVMAMNHLFELDKKKMFQECTNILFKFLDWDSLISSKLFVQQYITISGRYLFIAKLLVFTHPELTYEILVCPTFQFLDPDCNWILADINSDLELRNYVLHTFLLRSYRLNVQVVIQLYKNAFEQKLKGFDVRSYIEPMLNELLQENNTLCLKRLYSIFHNLIKHLNHDTIRAYIISSCRNFLSISEANKLMDKYIECKVYPQIINNELIVHNIEINTSMTDIELELIISYYFDCLIKIRNLPGGNRGLTFEISMVNNNTESAYPNIIRVRQTFQINKAIRRLLWKVARLKCRSKMFNRVEVEKEQLINYLEQVRVV